MAKEKDSNIVKIKKQAFHLNIGMLVFFIILFYTLYFAVRYFTTEHIMAYEVEEGSIVQNTAFTGIALRDEKIYYADGDGTIHFFVNEGSKVSVKSVVYSIDHSGVMGDYLAKHEDEISALDSSDLKDYNDFFMEYSNSYDDNAFSQVYQFKKTTSDKLAEHQNKNALDVLTASGDASLPSLSLSYAKEPGVVVYSTDGYENVSLDNLNSFMFRKANYVCNDIPNGSDISAGNVAYKLITSDDWDLIVPIDTAMAESLEDGSGVEVLFLKDNVTCYATVSLIYKEDSIYADLAFSNSMVRYATDRFLDIKLLTNTVTGLKIPNSSITSKEFFLVPKEYLTYGSDSSDTGFMKEVTDEDGNTQFTFIPCEIYYQVDDYYYIANDELAVGDVLRLSDSAERFILSKTDSLQGVYNINKGYAVFKQIDIMYQNEEYTIVAKNTEYGLSQFDYIAIDAEDLYEGQIVQ